MDKAMQWISDTFLYPTQLLSSIPFMAQARASYCLTYSDTVDINTVTKDFCELFTHLITFSIQKTFVFTITVSSLYYVLEIIFYLLFILMFIF